jgi:hypothetical protein
MNQRSEARRQRDAFIADALAAEQELLASGPGYAAADVHRHIRAHIAGEEPQRSAPKFWRNQVSRSVAPLTPETKLAFFS